MNCPFCKTELVPGELQRFETLAEHCLDPNQEEFPLRPTFVCTCERARGYFWNEDGEHYSTEGGYERSRRDRQEFGSLDALNSLFHRIELKMRREERLRKHW